MPLTIILPPGLPEAIAKSLRAPLRLVHLERLLAASTIAYDPRPVERSLADQLGIVAAADIPIAPLRLAGENADCDRQAQNGYWLCADPVATTTGIDSVRLDQGVDDLDAAEAGAIVATLSAFFAADGLRLIAPVPSRWYVRCDAAQQLASVPLERALGTSMLASLPTGTDAAAWRSRMNEAQMLLHAHPVNVEREARGQAPVASCWWWGGGNWPGWREARVDVVAGGPSWVASACRANRIETVPLPTSLTGLPNAGARRVLVILHDAAAVSAPDGPGWTIVDHLWLGALHGALDAGAIERASIVLPWGDGTLVIEVAAPSPISFWRDWRQWRSWFGWRAAAPPSLPNALEAFLQ